MLVTSDEHFAADARSIANCGRIPGGNFYELRKWSDDDWKQARELIEKQNAKDKAQR